MNNAEFEHVKGALAADYELLRELGGGGMSQVFVARDLHLDREVVVKVLPSDVTAGMKADRFHREIHLVARLQHPHIVPILAAGSCDGLLYYTMPFVDGPSLAARLKDKAPIDQLEAISILRDVADALSYAHSEGVVHRDIKPANILLRSHHAMVVDFGVAKAVTASVDEANLTATGLALGTPMYISPEQAVADPSVDGRADIYSLGIVAYELLTGRPPFNAASQQALLAAHVTSTPTEIEKINPQIPVALASLVMRCIEKDRDARWQSAAELRDELNSLGARFTPARSKPVDHHSPAHALSSTRAQHKRTWTRFDFTVIGAIAILLIAVGGTIAWRRARTGPPPVPAVAILPFENVDSAAGTDYFADGITRELGANLGKIDGLRVASMTSSSAARKKMDDTRQIASKLNVDAVVEGTVTHSGSEMVVSARLTNGKTGYQMWSSEFTDRSGNVAALQSKIARAIGIELVGRLVPRKGHQLNEEVRTDPRVLEYFYQGKYLENDFDREKLELAMTRYKLALSIDPSFARGYAAIANVMYHLADDYLPPGKSYPDVERFALKAITLDSTLAEAHASLGAYEVSYGWHWGIAKKHLEKAVALDPQSSFAHMMLGWYYVIIGVPSTGVEEALKAASLDPYSDEIGGNVVSLMRAAGRHDLAIAEIRRQLLDDVGDKDQLLARLARETLSLGNVSLASAQLDSALAIDSLCCKRTRAFIYAAKGKRAEALGLIRELELGRDKKYYRADFLAEARAVVNDTSAVLYWLEKAYQDKSSSMPLFMVSEELKPFHQDPRFKALQLRLGLNPDRSP